MQHLQSTTIISQIGLLMRSNKFSVKTPKNLKSKILNILKIKTLRSINPFSLVTEIGAMMAGAIRSKTRKPVLLDGHLLQ